MLLDSRGSLFPIQPHFPFEGLCETLEVAVRPALRGAVIVATGGDGAFLFKLFASLEAKATSMLPFVKLTRVRASDVPRSMPQHRLLWTLTPRRCRRDAGPRRCGDGGFTVSKLSEIVKLKGNDSEAGSFDLTCLGKSIVSATVGLLHGDVASFKDATTESEMALMSALSQRPVSIVIEADQSFFPLYKTGGITATCETELDYGVFAVGDGTECGTDEFFSAFEG